MSEWENWYAWHPALISLWPLRIAWRRTIQRRVYWAGAWGSDTRLCEYREKSDGEFHAGEKSDGD